MHLDIYVCQLLDVLLVSSTQPQRSLSSSLSQQRDAINADLLVYDTQQQQQHPSNIQVIQRHPLFMGKTYVGNNPSTNNIVLTDPSISPCHAVIEIEEPLIPLSGPRPSSYKHTQSGLMWDSDEIYVTDLGSTNSTFILLSLSDQPVQLPRYKRLTIKPARIIKFGGVYTSIEIKVNDNTYQSSPHPHTHPCHIIDLLYINNYLPILSLSK